MNEPSPVMESDDLPDTHKQILDKRLAEFEREGDLGDSWENVRERILKQWSSTMPIQNF
jgi:hypothetical protein